ncbi:MAG: hypothetical protein HPY66_1644 [Firmicutes bacterium]|nr:hypothetical protein [Bacillota bacterium]
MGDEYMTKKELGKMLKISIPTIDRWRQDGMPSEKFGRGVRFKAEETLEWIKKNKGTK